MVCLVIVIMSFCFGQISFFILPWCGRKWAELRWRLCFTYELQQRNRAIETVIMEGIYGDGSDDLGQVITSVNFVTTSKTVFRRTRP